MKKIGFLFPVLFILMFMMITPKVFSGSISPSTVPLIIGGLIAVMFLFRPKKDATKSAQDVAEELLDEYSADAFADDEALSRKFYSALNDIGSNMPKSAVSKLEKLASQCTGKKEQYAVAMATALAWRKQNQYKNAVREYNKAVVIHPNADLAYTIGEIHQRLGNQNKARDSYEFAIELNPGNARYFSSLGTTYVGEGDYDTAMDYAQDALDLDENYPQALATIAICYGVRNDDLMYSHYLRRATENGYSEQKIKDTVKALKKG